MSLQEKEHMSEQYQGVLDQLENNRLKKFIEDERGIQFIQSVIITQAKKEGSDWVLLARVFELMYLTAQNH